VVTAARTTRIDPTTLPGRPCSAAAALELVGDRWALLAVREVLWGNRRFSDIARNTGAPRDRLAARLKVLVEAGVLERRQYQDSPARWDYHATPAGLALAPVIEALVHWGDEWAVDAPPITLLHHDHVLRSSRVCSDCGETVQRRDVHRRMNVPGWDVTGPVAD
jgi:DNA-binding HxlR family transcriptional regulator